MTMFTVNRYLLLVALFFFTISIFSVAQVSLAQTSNEAGLNISPAVVEPDRTLDPGTTHQFSFTVKNLNPTVQTFYISTRDIVDVIDGATPVFADGTQEKTGMELSAWMKLGTDQITLEPNASQQVDFTITIPSDGTPGSHFGSVFVSVDPPEIENNGAAIGYKVANIVTIRVTGDAVDDASIREFSTKRYFNSSKNIDFSTRIENKGNVLIRPIGPVEIKNMLGQKVDTIMFNSEQQGAVFPGRVRDFTFNWSGQGVGFGRYEAIISPVYGENGVKKTMSSTVTFWILPMKIIGPALAALAVLLLITFVFVRIYIRRTLAKYSYGQTRVISRRKNNGVSGTLLLITVLITVTAIFTLILLALFA
jgi:hypothetical protein